ncbi:MAG: ElyC/SanA/YdcF family protein [Candidatus Micrarchaeia archaeon]
MLVNILKNGIKIKKDDLMKTAVLIANGIFDAALEHYKKYLDEFVDFVNKNKIEKVILCGGYTTKESPLSEAASVKQYIEPKISKDIKIILEEQSITASQSIKFSKKLVKLKPEDEVTVFCDSSIAVKVMWFVMHYWFKLKKKEIYDDAFNYIKMHYSKHNKTEDIGKSILLPGILYKNVEIHPCTILPSIESALAQQMISIIDIGALYDKELNEKFIEITKERYNLNDSSNESIESEESKV